MFFFVVVVKCYILDLWWVCFFVFFVVDFFVFCLEGFVVFDYYFVCFFEVVGWVVGVDCKDVFVIIYCVCFLLFCC